MKKISVLGLLLSLFVVFALSSCGPVEPKDEAPFAGYTYEWQTKTEFITLKFLDKERAHIATNVVKGVNKFSNLNYAYYKKDNKLVLSEASGKKSLDSDLVKFLQNLEFYGAKYDTKKDVIRLKWGGGSEKYAILKNVGKAK